MRDRWTPSPAERDGSTTSSTGACWASGETAMLRLSTKPGGRRDRERARVLPLHVPRRAAAPVRADFAAHLAPGARDRRGPAVPADGLVDRRRPRRQPVRHGADARPRGARRRRSPSTTTDEVHRLGGELSLSSRLVKPTPALLTLAASAHDGNPAPAGRALPAALIGVIYAEDRGDRAGGRTPGACARRVEIPPYETPAAFAADLATIAASLAAAPRRRWGGHFRTAALTRSTRSAASTGLSTCARTRTMHGRSSASSSGGRRRSRATRSTSPRAPPARRRARGPAPVALAVRRLSERTRSGRSATSTRPPACTPTTAPMRSRTT